MVVGHIRYFKMLNNNDATETSIVGHAHCYHGVFLAIQVAYDTVVDEFLTFCLRQSSDFQRAQHGKRYGAIVAHQVGLQGTGGTHSLTAGQCVSQRWRYHQVEGSRNLRIYCVYCNCQYIFGHDMCLIEKCRAVGNKCVAVLYVCYILWRSTGSEQQDCNSSYHVGCYILCHIIKN